MLEEARQLMNHPISPVKTSGSVSGSIASSITSSLSSSLSSLSSIGFRKASIDISQQSSNPPLPCSPRLIKNSAIKSFFRFYSKFAPFFNNTSPVSFSIFYEGNSRIIPHPQQDRHFVIVPAPLDLRERLRLHLLFGQLRLTIHLLRLLL